MFPQLEQPTGKGRVRGGREGVEADYVLEWTIYGAWALGQPLA
jgi:hypothetical protein